MRQFFKYAIAVERLTAEAGNKEAYASNGTVYGWLTNASPEDLMLSEGNPATSAVLICEAGSDIKVGDRITYNDGNKYIVKGVKDAQRLFSVAFRRCVVEKMAS